MQFIDAAVGLRVTASSCITAKVAAATCRRVCPRSSTLLVLQVLLGTLHMWGSLPRCQWRLCGACASCIHTWNLLLQW